MSPSTARAFKTAAYAHLAGVGKALGSATRLEILELLAAAPRTVEVLAGELGQSTANTSHHLQVLKRSHLVHARRHGLHVAYSLAGPDVAGLLVALHGVAQRRVAALEKLTHTFFDDLDGAEPLDRAELLQRMQEEDIVLIDVRPAREFDAGHLDGARSLPLTDLAARVFELPRDRTIVAYCRGPFCTFSAEAVRRLRALGLDARRTTVSIHSIDTAAPPR